VLRFAPQPLNCVLRWTHNFASKSCVCAASWDIFFHTHKMYQTLHSSLS
jgi:hypothetical protein